LASAPAAHSRSSVAEALFGLRTCRALPVIRLRGTFLAYAPATHSRSSVAEALFWPTHLSRTPDHPSPGHFFGLRTYHTLPVIRRRGTFLASAPTTHSRSSVAEALFWPPLCLYFSLYSILTRLYTHVRANSCVDGQSHLRILSYCLPWMCRPTVD